ncbi:Crp/Fnr family transcriptional regulator [Sphingomonas ginkgonis]|uniref:Crp/Fnr family transcriptional regulator n=1 Tax=Sphingomonas ginkgonis TaxID=2315330 RepID=A0A429VC05_9SPHN|nr:Crp/Fnr family transcriptional regulator [Sphingomonas ginkgonis]RST31508.1 Crp/Fnr family transcriptional regulator [Sphingomonas ginkgonis]
MVDPQTPSANLLFRRFSLRDRAALATHIVPISGARGDRLVPPASGGSYVYLSDGPLISLEQRNGIEVALIGREGIVGWPALVGSLHAPFGLVIRGREGMIYRIEASVLIKIAAANPTIAIMLNRFVVSISMQMAETIAAYAAHRIEMRLARWMLLRHDRAGGDELLAQHDEIAMNLGTRRASITDCLHVIEGEGVVRCRRGKLMIRDRARLESLAGGCYGSAEAFYADMIGPFGKSAETLRSASSMTTDLSL